MTKLKNNLLSAGIAVLLTIFFAYGTYVFYPGPDYNECYSERPIPAYYDDNRTFNQTAWEEQQECNERQNDLRERSQARGMIALSILGTLAIIGGALMINRFEYIGNGIFAGGILTVVYGTLSNWGALNQYLRLFLIGLALALLIYFGYKKIDKK